MIEQRMRRRFKADVVVPGTASAVALKSSEALSFWGGYDAATGEILDRRHPLSGQIAAGKILVVPFTKGSSTTSAILLEAVRVGVAPAAIVSRGRDGFSSLASIVADVLYQKPFPVLAASREDFDCLRSGQRLEIALDGWVTIATNDVDRENGDSQDGDAGG
jgi:predicted aconitase with swiveling domain